MLGNHALFPEPLRVRRQAIDAVGESFQIRIGLMNETGPRTELSPLYSTGLLARVEYADGLIQLHVREEMAAINSYRVVVWERGQPLPRALEPGVVHAHGRLIEVLALSVHEPLGWAISLDTEWRGFRFAVDPGSTGWPELEKEWCATLDDSSDWQSTARALCAWRFPVLMEPFLNVVRSRVWHSPVETLFAWTQRILLDDYLLTAEPTLFTAPLRELLWEVSFDTSASESCWVHHERAVQDRGFAPDLYQPAAALLRANPVLLAKVLADGLLTRYYRGKKSLRRIQKTLFSKEIDPVEAERHRKDFELRAQLILVALKGSFGGDIASRPDDLTALEKEALSGLRSWSDNRPMDEYFFHQRVRNIAEALFAGLTADSTQLRLAVARSPVCSAYLAAFLFCKNVFRPLQKDEL
jgi:hypothetical protein